MELEHIGTERELETDRGSVRALSPVAALFSQLLRARWTATRCLPCPTGNFSYAGSVSCSGCPSRGAACVQGRIELLDGFWRKDPPGSRITSDTVFYPCPTPKTCFAESNLTGLEVVGGLLRQNQTRCADGHGGPLCALCTTGYGKSVWSKMCYKCGGEDLSSGDTLVVVLLAGSGSALLLLCACVALLWRDAAMADDENDNGDGDHTEDFRSVIDMAKFKILLSWLQVASTLAQTFDVPWPEAFRDQVNAVYSVVNLDAFAMLGDAVCGLKMTAITQLLLHLASLPAVFATIALSTMVTHKLIDADDRQRRRMR